MELSSLLMESDLTGYISENLSDLWEGTPLQGYKLLDNKQKGGYGEVMASKLCEQLGLKVTNRVNSDHDMVVNGYKTEVKFSIAQTNKDKTAINKDVFMMNQVGVGKDYDRLLFIGINPNFEESRIVWFDKKDIKKIINNKDYFGYQQGGNNAENDDYMSGSARLIRLINSKYARTLEQW